MDKVRTLLAEGLTHAEAAERLSEETGERVTRQAVSVALHRAGLTDHQPRYDDLLPWRVRMPHARQYPALMLRAFGRRRAGLPLPDDLDRKLNLWLARLQEERVVIDYDEEQGFVYVPRLRSDRAEELIRRPRPSRARKRA